MPECAGPQGDATGAARTPCQDCVVVQHTSCGSPEPGLSHEFRPEPDNPGDLPLIRPVIYSCLYRGRLGPQCVIRLRRAFAPPPRRPIRKLSIG